MRLIEADYESLKLLPMERAKYSFRRMRSQVEIYENGEGLVAQKEIEAAGIICKPFWDVENNVEGDCYKKYIARHPEFTLSVRQQVLEMLVAAQRKLPPNWQIVLKAGFRPYEVQEDLLKAFARKAQSEHSEWTYEQSLRYARDYVVDPAVSVPPHATGGAVDLYIRDLTRPAGSRARFIDMGCAPNSDEPRAHLFSAEITEQQQAHRMCLLTAMLAVGFAPLANEWWHYQYGETTWAAFYGKRRTRYGIY